VHSQPSRRHFARALGWLLFGAVAMAGLAACGGAQAGNGSGAVVVGTPSTTSTTITAQAPTNVGFGSGSIGAADPTTTVPNERGNPIPSSFAAGQNIIIRRNGLYPRTLEANISNPIVWTNLSGVAQRIIFENFPVDSGTIPPGGTFTWSATNVVALEYKSAAGYHGVLDLNAAAS
jgi:hypothetical protein